MELKAGILSIFLLFLLLASPCLPDDSGIYDIDYRGPETHSYIPPPNRSGGKHHSIPRLSSLKHRKSRAGKGAKGKRIRG
ncbi:uncharacterized protein LOC127790807 [Diospyros lotus]|uniref:uncharacterized protein LOC127790807 n=1 Tax=Diospyros lotus TaxID=55363 RepID=UPI002251C87D|nr:uncharacterized protein LOC127790807 [Diospyros lotus]